MGDKALRVFGLYTGSKHGIWINILYHKKQNRAHKMPTTFKNPEDMRFLSYARSVRFPSAAFFDECSK